VSIPYNVVEFLERRIPEVVEKLFFFAIKDLKLSLSAKLHELTCTLAILSRFAYFVHRSKNVTIECLFHKEPSGKVPNLSLSYH